MTLRSGRCVEHSLESFVAIQHRLGVSKALEALAEVASSWSERSDAATLLGAAAALRTLIGASPRAPDGPAGVQGTQGE